jgi:hypothetical protein
VQYPGKVNATPSGLVNGSVAAGANLQLPPQVADQIDKDQENQDYTGKPMDPPKKTL